MFLHRQHPRHGFPCLQSNLPRHENHKPWHCWPSSPTFSTLVWPIWYVVHKLYIYICVYKLIKLIQQYDLYNFILMKLILTVAGKRFLYWNGSEPRLCLTETKLIKEFLSKHSTVSGKSWQQRQGSKNFIGEGLLMANGEDWYHQRHIVAPAFMGDRLKVFDTLITKFVTVLESPLFL